MPVCLHAVSGINQLHLKANAQWVVADVNCWDVFQPTNNSGGTPAIPTQTVIEGAVEAVAVGLAEDQGANNSTGSPSAWVS